MDDTKVLLMQLPFWDALTEQDRLLMEETAYMKHYEPGEIFYDAEHSTVGMLIVLAGEIRAYMLSEEGREVTLYRLQPGDRGVLSVSSAISQISMDTHLEARSPVDLLMIPASVFQNLVENNVHVRCFTYELMTHRFAVIMWVFQQILFAGFDQRLASFLIEESRRTGSKEITMTQEQIAEYINSAREVVARMLRRFASEGLIDNKRGVITLLDIPALKKICSGIVVPEELRGTSEQFGGGS